MRRVPAVLLAASLVAGAVVLSTSATAGRTPTSGTVRDGLMTFTPATVVDPLLFGGEPGFKFDPSNRNRSFVDWPVSSRQNIGVLYRSEDGGLSYTKRYMDPNDAGTLGPACVGRQVPFCFAGGGGDTEVNINPGNGILYMSSQEALVNQASGTSFDHGDTFPLMNTDPLVARTASGVDRQWIASRTKTKDVYLAYHVPAVGEYIHKSTEAGAFGSWSSPATPQVTGVTQSGSFLMDNSGGIHDGTLYVAYLGFPEVNSVGTGFLVAASTDGGKTFTSHSVPGGANARNFTVLQVDRVGNLYATWVDNRTQKTYLSTSKADAGSNRTKPASQWSKPVVVSSGGLNVTIFSNLAAGDPGRVAVGYYGTSAKAATPDDVKKGAGGWSPYVSTSFNALCQWDRKPCKNGPLFHESVISHHINQDDNICTSGTACLATGGNRNLLDYFSINLDSDGHLGFVWSDTTNGIGMPFVKVTRQASGPSLYKGKPDARLSLRGNGEPDKGGDARYPIYGKAVRTAPSYKALDLLGTRVERKGDVLRVTVKVADTVALGGKLPAAQSDGSTLLQQAKYLVRWDYKGQVFYAGMNMPKGGEGTVPTFFSGAVTADTGGPGIMAAGGTPGSYYGVSYPATRTVKGTLTRQGFVVEVPLKDVGGAGAGARLHSVGSYAMLGPVDGTVVLNNLPVVVDSTPTFDTRLR